MTVGYRSEGTIADEPRHLIPRFQTTPGWNDVTGAALQKERLAAERLLQSGGESPGPISRNSLVIRINAHRVTRKIEKGRDGFALFITQYQDGAVSYTH